MHKFSVHVNQCGLTCLDVYILYTHPKRLTLSIPATKLGPELVDVHIGHQHAVHHRRVDDEHLTKIDFRDGTSGTLSPQPQLWGRYGDIGLMALGSL